MIALTHELEEAKREIELLSKQIYVDRYFSVPEVTVIPLRLLGLYMYRMQFDDRVRKAVLTTTGLIQLGLDMHDRVTNNKEFVRDRITERQMLILAGDYYSSICYNLMAKVGLTCEVRKLAKGITKNTAAKMQLYDFNSDNNFKLNDDIVDLIKIREASLYTEFLTGDLVYEEQAAWMTIFENLIVYSFNLRQSASGKILDNTLSFFLIRALAEIKEMTELYAVSDSADYQRLLFDLAKKYQVAEIINEINQELIREAKDSAMLVDCAQTRSGLEQLVTELEIS